MRKIDPNQSKRYRQRVVNSMDGSNQPNPLAGDFLTVLKQRRLISDIPTLGVVQSLSRRLLPPS